MMFPDYQRTADPQVRALRGLVVGSTLPVEPGLTVVEIIDAAIRSAGRI